jgi:hypothetical protein
MEKFTLASSPEPVPPIDWIGRDEMNLAEFPITLLTDRVPAGQKTLRYEDRNGTLIVTGSDDYGLPTAADADVIVALIQLTKKKNNFSDHTVNFTRYELIKILNWQDIGKSYHRLFESLHRWAGVTLRYQGTWWNNEKKQNVSVTMHILDTVILYERTDDKSPPALPLSSFTWNKTFLRSCQAGNLKSLNLGLYFSLRHPSSKRLYRFLDKRFNGKSNKSEHVFPLRELAITRVGLSPTHARNVAKLKEKLQPAIAELEQIGFLVPLPRDERYRKEDGQWTVHFSRHADGSVRSTPGQEKRALTLPPAGEPPLVAELASRGVSPSVAKALVQEHAEDTIRLQIEHLDWLVQTKPRKIADPAAWLVAAIRNGHVAPKGFVSKAERQRREEVRQAQDEQQRRQREQEQRERALRAEADASIKQLTPSERKTLEAEALAQASPEARQSYETTTPVRFRKALLLSLLREHVVRKLSREAVPALSQVADPRR